jgi:hypothetical protein
MSTHPEFLHWRLRLSHDKEWQAQYTGFDPALILPREFSDYHAMGFLIAEARFQDAILPLDHSLLFLNRYLRKNENEAVKGLLKRASFNTSVTDVKSGVMGYLGSYMHDTDETISGKIHYNVEKPYETVLQRFKEACKTHKGKLSARGFMQIIAERIKPQYVEGWLLYRGQTLEELRELAASDATFPAEHKATIEAVWNAYNESGLAAQVERLRHWADSPIAQAERRTKVMMDIGKPHGIIPVGAIDTSVRIAPKSSALSQGT